MAGVGGGVDEGCEGEGCSDAGGRASVVGRGLSRMTGGEWIEGTEKKRKKK